MKKSRRQIRDSVLLLCAVTILITVASGLYASRVNADTPPGLRKLMSLGLKVITQEEPPAEPQKVSLHEVQEFSKVQVQGGFAVEVIRADRHRVSMTPAPGSTWLPDALWSKGGLLRIEGGADAAGAVLRVEAPTLESIDVQGAALLLARGLRAPTISLRMQDVGSAQILEDEVGRWSINALTPVELRMGNGSSLDATFKVSGPMSISVADKSARTPQP